MDLQISSTSASRLAKFHFLRLRTCTAQAYTLRLVTFACAVLRSCGLWRRSFACGIGGGGGLWKTGTKEKRRRKRLRRFAAACGLWRRSLRFACGLWHRHRRRPVVACAFAFRLLCGGGLCASAFRFGGGLWPVLRSVSERRRPVLVAFRYLCALCRFRYGLSYIITGQRTERRTAAAFLWCLYAAAASAAFTTAAACACAAFAVAAAAFSAAARSSTALLYVS